MNLYKVTTEGTYMFKGKKKRFKGYLSAPDIQTAMSMSIKHYNGLDNIRKVEMIKALD